MGRLGLKRALVCIGRDLRSDVVSCDTRCDSLMPLYEYRCPKGHVHERLRKYSERDEPCICVECDEEAKPILSIPHVEPDGVYSHTPNIGSADAFDRKQAKLARDCEARKDGLKPKLTEGYEV